MNTNMQLLKGKIVERQTTQEAVADAVGIDRSTFYRKLKTDGMNFSIAEAHKIVAAIPLTKEEAIAIFFADSVA